MLQPTVRRTWAPRSQTPILKSCDRRDRLSAISAVTVSPERRRPGLYFDILTHNVKADDFEVFVDHLLRRIGRPVILVIDRYFSPPRRGETTVGPPPNAIVGRVAGGLRSRTQSRRTGVEPDEARRPGPLRPRRRAAPGSIGCCVAAQDAAATALVATVLQARRVTLVGG